MYNFKKVECFIGNGSCFDFEWMYMLKNGRIVSSRKLIVEDETDANVARSYGWTEEEIDSIRVFYFS